MNRLRRSSYSDSNITQRSEDYADSPGVLGGVGDLSDPLSRHRMSGPLAGGSEDSAHSLSTYAQHPQAHSSGYSLHHQGYQYHTQQQGSPMNFPPKQEAVEFEGRGMQPMHRNSLMTHPQMTHSPSSLSAGGVSGHLPGGAMPCGGPGGSATNLYVNPLASSPSEMLLSRAGSVSSRRRRSSIRTPSLYSPDSPTKLKMGLAQGIPPPPSPRLCGARSPPITPPDSCRLHLGAPPSGPSTSPRPSPKPKRASVRQAKHTMISLLAIMLNIYI